MSWTPISRRMNPYLGIVRTAAGHSGTVACPTFMERQMSRIDYRLFGIREPDAFETGLSWEEVLVWIRISKQH